MSHFQEHAPQKFGRARGLENDLEGLGWINDFGWLRSVELGMLVWPYAVEPRKYGERLTRKWLKRSLVLRRELPNGAGAAYVLSAAGVSFLEEYDIPAKSGKNWGRTVDRKWSAPGSWRHDLLVAGLLAHLHRKGFTVLPENRIRRENPDLAKIPDGLAILDGKVYWIEAERARKTGDRMNDLARLVEAVNEGEVQPVSGYVPTACAICFDPQARDENGHAISHSLRIRRALAERSMFDAYAVFLQLDVLDHTIIGMKQEQPSIIESLNVSHLVAELEFRTMVSGSSPAAEYKICHVDEYLLRYQKKAGSSEPDPWEWIIGYLGPGEEELGKARLLQRGTAPSEARCERALAMAYLRRYQFDPWDQDIESM